MFVIYDELHDEDLGRFASAGEAVTELRRRARIPWNQAPNQAPCISWRTCRRTYYLVEFEDSNASEPLGEVPVLEVSASGVMWSAGFEDC